MDKNDRAMIDRCIDCLVPKVNMVKLWPKLIEKRVFNPDDVNVPRWEKNLAAQETVRQILTVIKTRGPDAFTNLVFCLRQTQHHALADVLQGHRPLDDKLERPEIKPESQRDESDDSEDDDSVNDDYNERSGEPLVIKVRKAKKFRDNRGIGVMGRYPMRSRPRGYVLIITIQDSLYGLPREGSQHDEACLKKLFQDMGFEVTSHMNLTGKGILDAIEEFAKKDFRPVDSCFVVMSAHGHATIDKNGITDTELAGTDYGYSGAEKVSCNAIVNRFTVKQCPHLNRKPKIFIFQACRGVKHHDDRNTSTDGIDPRATERNYSDIMIAHATMYGYVAYRDNVSGSWFIQTLCNVFMNYAHKVHLLELFQMVDRRLSNFRTGTGAVQIAPVELLGFNMRCYLNPGLFEDENS